MPAASERLLVLLFAVLLCVPCAGQWAAPRTDTRDLLSQLEVGDGRTARLAALFASGDEQVEDLVRALDDPDPEVRDNAQLVIRYLGNKAGLEALVRHYAKSNTVTVVGPVPLPLTEWDYDFINTTYLNRPKNFGQLSTQYLYALSLDGSARAKELLPKMLETAERAGTDPFTLEAVRAQGVEPTFNSGAADLGEGVLKAAKFLRPSDKRHASAKLLAFNKAQDKALVEIYVDHGVLAEATYHVVVNKCRAGWKFFSISLIAVS